MAKGKGVSAQAIKQIKPKSAAQDAKALKRLARGFTKADLIAGLRDNSMTLEERVAWQSQAIAWLIMRELSD